MTLLIVPTAAVGEETWPDREALVNKAQEMSGQLLALAQSEGMLGLYTSSDNIVEIIQSIAARDYDQPTEALVVFMDDEFIQSALGMAADYGLELPQAEWVPGVLKAKTYNIVPNLLNAQQGTNWLAASSIMQLTRAFVLDDAQVGIACIILSYGEDPPFCFARDT